MQLEQAAPSPQPDALRPGVALATAALIPDARKREAAIRAAFVSACTNDRESARRFAPSVASRPWLGEIDFYDAVAVGDRVLMLASAARHPELAMREWESYRELEFGREVLNAAIAAAPDEAVGIFRDLGGMLGTISRRADLDPPTRAKVAVLFREIERGTLSIDQAAQIVRRNARFFDTLANARLRAKGSEAKALDRYLADYSLRLCRAWRDGNGTAELSEFTARNLYLLLAYGRGEEDEDFFVRVFDTLLAPRLHDAAKMVESTQYLKYRSFVTAAVGFKRLETFLRLGGSEELIARFVRGIDKEEAPLEEAGIAAEILEGGVSDARLQLLAKVTVEEYRRAETANDADAKTLYGVLGARLRQKAARSSPELDAVAAPYTPHLREVRGLPMSDLFPGGKPCVQRYFFWNDQDGVESFETFLKGYGGWKLENAGAFVRLSGGPPARRMEIYANVPVDITKGVAPGVEADATQRQDVLTRTLRERGAEPAVMVHRGHNYHLDKTLSFLTPKVRLVYLGSCWGMGKMSIVMERAPEAHVIATRGIGATSVNDPVLRALTDALLQAGPTLDWAGFWASLGARFGARQHFGDYVPPHRNGAGVLLRAYYEARPQ